VYWKKDNDPAQQSWEDQHKRLSYLGTKINNYLKSNTSCSVSTRNQAAGNCSMSRWEGEAIVIKTEEMIVIFHEYEEGALAMTINVQTPEELWLTTGCC
jgi:hypothetical protein